ncbi:MAG TPA: hypothetical protein VKU85_14825 [bacterium]|nr:hypothetical protein [bacterium]
MIGRRTALRSVALLAFAFGMFALMGASECAKVDNSVTGPEEEEFLPAPGRDPCVQECWAAAMAARDEEIHRHRQAIHNCDRDPECVAAENELNEMNLRAIKAEFFECREACHEQGGGSGGQ